ncbi:hypothetical protein HIM_02890 [Hirsutella minnesotensis 3608]|nr:hypothetical protein HIM_02890 [Hirsutella minnesotensis 3608]
MTINSSANGRSCSSVNGYVNGGQLSNYEQLGQDLVDNIKGYVRQLRKEGNPLPSLAPSNNDDERCNSEAGERARAKIVRLAQEILATTMDPSSNLLISSLQFHFCSCLKVAVDLDIVEHIPKDDQVSAKELAAAVGTQEALLVRIMRVLTAKYVFAEPRPGFYSHTAMSWRMRGPEQKYLLIHRLDEGFRSASRQADTLRLSGYREPVLGDLYGFNLAFDTQTNFWEHITVTEPRRGEIFNRAMKTVSINSLDAIPALYPFDKLAGSGGLIVDVGGGLGQVGRRILAHYPNSGLKVIVQDQFASEKAQSSSNNAINGCQKGQQPEVDVTLQQHNFFNPQPVKGASAYFLRHIFHDWPDSACVDILKQIVAAMDPEKSRILLCDQVMDHESPSLPSVLYDIDMMSMFGGKERLLSEWKSLLAEADERLYVTDVMKSSTSSTTILEVRLR